MTNTTDPAEHLRLMLARAKVLATAVPTYLAAFTAILGVVATQIVPNLPEGYGAQVAAWIVTALAFIDAVRRTVSVLTPADPATHGILPVADR